MTPIIYFDPIQWWTRSISIVVTGLRFIVSRWREGVCETLIVEIDKGEGNLPLQAE